MPYRRRTATKKRSARPAYRRRYRARRNYRRRRGGIVTSRIPRSPVPDRTLVKLKYPQRVVPLGTSGAISQQIFRGSDLYDPDYTGAGYQPQGFDQWMAFYDQFFVSASKIQVTVVQSYNATPLELAIAPADSATEFNTYDMELVRNYRRAKGALFQPGSGPRTLTNYCTISQALGRRVRPNDPGYSGSSSVSPTSLFYWAVVSQSADETSTISGTQLYVNLTYYVCLSRPTFLGLS